MKGYVLTLIMLIGFFRKIYEPVSEKTNNVGFGQVQHKPGCTSTEAG